jgi:hypothetical protein
MVVEICHLLVCEISAVGVDPVPVLGALFGRAW